MVRVGSYAELMMSMGRGGRGDVIEMPELYDECDVVDCVSSSSSSSDDAYGVGGSQVMVKVILSSTSRMSRAELRRMSECSNFMCSDM